MTRISHQALAFTAALLITAFSFTQAMMVPAHAAPADAANVTTSALA